MFKGVNIVIGITGGIAAYKVCSIISHLKNEGANVDVIMTKSACEFITPLTIETLSGNKVIVDMFDTPDYREVKHISLANKADIFLICPATANIIGKVANGIADDMLSTTIMAATAPVVFAPAMNNGMYQNPIVQDNINKLKSFGYRFVGPAMGKLACGYDGIGKLEKNEKIVEYLEGMVKVRKHYEKDNHNSRRN